MPKGIAPITVDAKNIPEVQAHIAELTEQRDALLAACRRAEWQLNEGTSLHWTETVRQLSAAIARAYRRHDDGGLK